MSIITVDNKQIHYEAIGRGQPVLFVHGWLGSWRYWWPTMQAVSNICRAFALDLWGYGDSSKSPMHYDMDSYTMLLDEFQGGLGITQPVTLVGHALGAAVVLKYAVEKPSSVQRIIVVSPPLDVSLIHNSLALPRDAKSLARLLNLNSHHQAIISEIAKTDSQAIASTIGQIRHHAITEKIRSVTCPILLVNGDRDPVVGVEKLISGQLPGLGKHVRYLVLDHCAHFPMIERPAIFNRLLKEFIQGVGISELKPKEYWTRRTR